MIKNLQEYDNRFVLSDMKKKLFSAIFVVIATVALPVSAQMMPRGGFAVEQNSDTSKEEAEGRVIWEKLQSGTASCDNLSDEDYELLGEYFMGQWAGSSHEAMNQMMVRMMGEQGERQMHVALGKRQSGCDLNAQISAGGVGFMPMVGMMQNFGGGWFSFVVSLALTILVWLLIIFGIIKLIRWLVKADRSSRVEKEENSAMRILKERYARGEISKEEFEEKKRILH